MAGTDQHCSLVCHPRTPGAAVATIDVELAYVGDRELALRYRVVGELERVRVPGRGTELPALRLWEHTCCELFVAGDRGDGYREWNFSPTGQHACFGFSAYRERSPDEPAPAAVLRVDHDARTLVLESRVRVPDALGDRLRIGLAVVVRGVDDVCSYWAAQHPCERPDFHHIGGFALALELPRRDPGRGLGDPS